MATTEMAQYEFRFSVYHAISTMLDYNQSSRLGILTAAVCRMVKPNRLISLVRLIKPKLCVGQGSSGKSLGSDRVSLTALPYSGSGIYHNTCWSYHRFQKHSGMSRATVATGLEVRGANISPFCSSPSYTQCVGS